MFVFLLVLTHLSFASNDHYSFSSIKKVDDKFHKEHILKSKERSIIIFNNGSCKRPVANCYPLESKINSIAPKIMAHQPPTKIFLIDTEFNKSARRYNIKKYPSVVIVRNAQILKVIEPKRCNDYGRPPVNEEIINCQAWSIIMLQKLTDFL